MKNPFWIWLIFGGIILQCYQMPKRQIVEFNSKDTRVRESKVPSKKFLSKNPKIEDKLKLLAEIRTYLGTPYLLGGTTHRGIDCSGFVVAVYKSALGINLPHNSLKLYKSGIKIKRDGLKFGDLLFFKNTWHRGLSHVGIFLKGSKFIHASATKGVIISDLIHNKYYQKRYAGARRIIHF